ncbi:flavin reductase family protein [Streptomyces tauricus]|uniref:Flavin reductase family protein n=1 Tax=Streptomyces tauricus TaxID=68274 RepID=A0ABZ1JC70_9ACTN|nr:flavin reductase family protein [Streptomyces tauricus]
MIPGTLDATLFRSVLGHYPTGVALVTSAGEPPAGMVVGTFTSVSLDPPLVGFLPSKASTSWPRIRAGGSFCVNVLGADQREVCLAFTSRDTTRWEVPHHPAPSGAPALSGAIAWIDCDLADETEAGDHWFVTGHVRRFQVQHEGEPLLFLRGEFGAFAPCPAPVLD